MICKGCKKDKELVEFSGFLTCDKCREYHRLKSKNASPKKKMQMRISVEKYQNKIGKKLVNERVVQSSLKKRNSIMSQRKPIEFLISEVNKMALELNKSVLSIAEEIGIPKVQKREQNYYCMLSIYLYCVLEKNGINISIKTNEI